MHGTKERVTPLEALDGFANIQTNFRHLFRAKNKGNNADNNHKPRHTKSERTIPRKPSFMVLRILDLCPAVDRDKGLKVLVKKDEIEDEHDDIFIDIE